MSRIRLTLNIDLGIIQNMGMSKLAIKQILQKARQIACDKCRKDCEQESNRERG